MVRCSGPAWPVGRECAYDDVVEALEFLPRVGRRLLGAHHGSACTGAMSLQLSDGTHGLSGKRDLLFVLALVRVCDHMRRNIVWFQLHTPVHDDLLGAHSAGVLSAR